MHRNQLLWAQYYIDTYSFWGRRLHADPHRGSAPGPRWGTSVPQNPLLSRYTPCHYIPDKGHQNLYHLYCRLQIRQI